MSQFQFRQWRRTYRRQQAHRKKLNNLLGTSCRLLAVSLVAVAFLFYRLEMPGTLTLFTAKAGTDTLTVQAGVWEEEELVTVVYWQGQGQGGGNDRFQTNSNKEYVKFIINVQDVDPDSVYLVYNGEQRNPDWKPGDSSGGFAFLEGGFVYGNDKQREWDFGSFLKEQMQETGEKGTIEVTIFWQLEGDETEYSGSCQLNVQVPGGQAKVNFEIVSAGGDRGLDIMALDGGSRGEAQAEWLVANIQPLEGGRAADIDMGSLQLVYGGSCLEPERSDLEGDTLRVYFNRAAVDAWLQDLGVQGEQVLLTITGEMNTAEETIPFSASNYYQAAFEAEGAVNLSLRIEGPETITIPAEGQVTETYNALVVDGEDQEVTGAAVIWSLEGEAAGLTVDKGRVTVTSGAEEGSFTLVAALAGQEDIKDTISVDLIIKDTISVDLIRELETGPGEESLEGFLPGMGAGPSAEGEQPPAEGEGPPAEGEPVNEGEPGAEPPEDGDEPGEEEPTEEAIREDDGGGGDAADQDGDDDDQDPGGGDEDALPREDDDNEGDELGDGDDDGEDDFDPEEDEPPAETGEPDQEGEEPGDEGPEPGSEVEEPGDEGPEPGSEVEEPAQDQEPGDDAGGDEDPDLEPGDDDTE